MIPDEITMVLRIALAAGLGLVIGLERERHNRAAGLRTCLLVAMAGGLIMSLSLYLSQILLPHGAESILRMDPGRLPSYAVAGMGFLGAGAIIKGHRSARGVTTAAAMWACTVIGLAVGAGLYLPALAVTLLTLAALFLLRPLAHWIRLDQYVRLTVEATHGRTAPAVRELLLGHGVRILFCGRERCLQTDSVTLNYSLEIRSGNQWGEMLAQLEQIDGVACYSWQEAEVP